MRRLHGWGERDAPGPAGLPGAERDGAGDDAAEDHERGGHHAEESVQAHAARAHDEPAAGAGHHQPRRAADDRPREAPGALRGEVEREPETEEAVDGTD